MANYLELYELASDTDLKKRVQVACAVAAEQIRATAEPAAPTNPLATPSSPEVVAYVKAMDEWTKKRRWAAGAMRQPQVEVERMIQAVLAQNRGLTTAQITGASDASLQTAVNSAVAVFAMTD